VLGLARPAAATANRSPARRRLAWRPTAVALLLAVGTLAAVRDMAVDRLSGPLRYAVVAQRIDRLTPDEKRQLLLDAIPDAYRASAWAPWDAALAEDLGRAFLHLSGGQPSVELAASRHWYSRAVRLTPANAGRRNTLAEISAVLDARP
jgi:hypothetical protein